MPTQLASLDSLVHPHQIEVQEFDSYGLVIDARSTEAYQEDHIPGAVSVPVAAQRLQVSKAEGSTLVASDIEPSIPYGLAGPLSGLCEGASVLVYCDRGGLDSLVWAEPLKAMGYRVDVLGGGWGNYRRWVDAGLEVLPRALTFRRLVAPPAGGLCQVIESLEALGEQVIDVAALAGQRLVPGLALRGEHTPSQAAFDSALLHRLRQGSPSRVTWIRSGNMDQAKVVLPAALRDALLRSSGIRLQVPSGPRAQAWRDRLDRTCTRPVEVLSALARSEPRPPAAEIRRWRSLANSGQLVDALECIITAHIDPSTRTEVAGLRAHTVHLASLSPEAISPEIDKWLRVIDLKTG